MGFVIALGKAAVGDQSRLDPLELSLADQRRNLGYQDPFFPWSIDPTERRMFAGSGGRASLQAAPAVPAIAVAHTHIGRIGQKASDAGQVPADQSGRGPDAALFEKAGQGAKAV